MDFDQSNKAFKKTLDFINNTDYSIFLNGKAGTGKTTFLRNLKYHVYKKSIIVAPTGVAAVNANGLTIHSFFQLPIASINPESIDFLKTIRFSADRKKLLKEIELLVIDEVSMVRADILDAIDKLLRSLRNEAFLPFGGLQVLYIGDLYQLSPITKDNDLYELQKWYGSPFFFDSKVFQESNPICIELEKVYRQSEAEFIDLLNGIRDNTIKEEQLDVLNRQVRKDFDIKNEGYIFLTTHNKKVDELNVSMLRHLPGQEYCFTAMITGKFDEILYPADYELHLKTGAQLMLLKNDKGKDRKYFNGKIGMLEKIEKEKLLLRFGDDQLLEVEKEVWRNIDYTYDETNSMLLENDLGTFQQFPVRLAWAITIHKSQGLTFEKAIVDVEDAFLPGQVYVALSRIRSLNGLILHSRINRSSINVDSRILFFLQKAHSQIISDDFIINKEANFIQKTIIKYLSWASIIESTKSDLFNTVDFLLPYFKIIYSQKNIADRFVNEVIEILNLPEDKNIERLNKRITTAIQYFTLEIDNKLLIPLKKILKDSRKNLDYKRYSILLLDLVTALEKKIIELSELSLISRGLSSSKKIGFILNEIKRMRFSKDTRKAKAPNIKKDQSTAQEEQNEILSLFSSGKTIQQIAAIKNLSVSAIEYQLAPFIYSGQISVLDIVSQNQLDTVMDILDKQANKSITTIKQKVGDNLSFGQIYAVIKHRESLIR